MTNHRTLRVRAARRHTTHRLTLPLAVAVLTAAACSPGPAPEARDTVAEPTPTEPATDAATTSTEPTTTTPSDHAASGDTAIRLLIADEIVTARLADNPTARELAAQLPLTLTFSDFNRVEKIATLPLDLTMDGVPPGDDPQVNDIGYYAPTSSLVLYYGDVGYWDGIVRIGQFDGDVERIERQPDGFRVTIERAT